MNSFLWLIILCICFVIVKSIIGFIQGDRLQSTFKMKERRFSTEIFYTLLIVYTIVMIGFALIYFILSFQGIILIEDGEISDPSVIGSFKHSFYFSGVTLLTIGYGDIAPIGIGRLIALIEALIGYVLPTAFVLRLVVERDKNGT